MWPWPISCCLYTHTARTKVEKNPDGQDPLVASILCVNHRNGLVEASATSLLGMTAVNAMYSMAGFLRMSGHFSRLVLSGDVYSSDVILRRGAPPQACLDYNMELLDYVLVNHKAEKRAHSRIAAKKT